MPSLHQDDCSNYVNSHGFHLISFLSEIEVLQSIYLDELQVDRRPDGGWEVSLVLYPSTAEDSVSQFVRLTLTLTLDQQYPSSSPVISIHNPRGLSDDKLSSVQKCLQVEAQSCLGSPVLYQLIEKAKEILTESNIPHGNCVICLYGFKERETFTKTSCYHYFHSHCLGRYVSHSEKELRQREKELEEDKTRDRADCPELTVVCPVCREPLAYDVDQLLSSPAPQLPELDEAAIDSDFQQKWVELQKLLERQRSKGGIIDPDEESNRFLIYINQTPSENGNLDIDTSPGPQGPSASNASSEDSGVRVDNFTPGLSNCRGGPGHRRQNQGRGSRRGGRSRPQHVRANPVTEQLDKLSLSLDCTEGPVRPPAQGNHDHQMQGQDAFAERQVSAGDLSGGKPYVETEYQKAAADSGGGRGHRGRRRGPHRSATHSGGPGPARYHWDGRASRSRGGAYNHDSRRGGGPPRGHGRGFHQKVVEREGGREEVL
ncbi:E3 ubiquitin-protein ligase RNF25-like isoform X1 [Echeneis naucrates]|uniref:E3 ubiquitin-protein ligase RNF25-like isoform X1 n=1 Tax=Echeneis naucrates TaxID=173247 RepID=UPI001113B624|nr:E3 ubiquitin-protein ligase RNF25-like isoform X1 [Echeneis naucrates]